MAILGAGYFQPGVKTSAAYNAALLKGLNAPPGSPEYTQASQEVIAQIAQGEQDRRGIALPQAIQDKARALGLFNSANAMNYAAANAATLARGVPMAMGRTFGVSRNQV